MMSYAQELPMYWRARLEVFREAIAQAQNDDPDLALLRNGVMRNKASEEMQSEARLKEKEFPNNPLSLSLTCGITKRAMKESDIKGADKVDPNALAARSMAV